jgi:hypothetical protein
LLYAKLFLAFPFFILGFPPVINFNLIYFHVVCANEFLLKESNKGSWLLLSHDLK